MYYRARGKQVIPLYRQVLRGQWRPAVELKAEWDAKLIRLLTHAAAHVPYYHGIDASGGLSAFPRLTKPELKRSFTALLAGTPSRGRSWESRSSGSTGQPVAVLTDDYAHDWRTATGWRGDCFGGLQPTDRFVALWSDPGDLSGLTFDFQ